MSILFLEYPKCTTCQKAKKWLVENEVDFTARHIVGESFAIPGFKETVWAEVLK